MPYRCWECRKREQFEKLKAKLIEYMRTLDSGLASAIGPR